MLIGPNTFLSSPRLDTTLLRGFPQYAGGTVFFAPDDKFLISVTAGYQLQVWDLSTLRALPVRTDRRVWRAVWADHLDGLLAVTDDGVLLSRFTGGNVREELLVTGLPPLSDEDGGVALYSTERNLVVCAANWIRCYDPISYALRVNRAIERPLDGSARRIRIREREGSPYLRIISHKRCGNLPGLLYTSVTMDGNNVSSIHVAIEEMKNIDSANASMGVFRGPGDSAIVLIDGDLDPFCLRTIRSTDPEMFECTSQGLMFLSENGNSFVGMTPRTLAVWRGGELINMFACEGHWCNARPSNNDAFVSVTYLNGPNSPDVSGILDATSGQILGWCTGHICGALSWAFSPSFFASVITDDLEAFHPDGLPSGTVVLTRLP